MKRKGIWALIIVGIMITLVFFGYHINKWSQIKVVEGDFVNDVEWKPDGSYALVVGGYVKRVESPDIEFVKPSDTPSSSWELLEIRYKIWRYSDDALTELMSWDDEEYDYPWKVSWAPNGSYALIWTDTGIYKYDDGQNTLTFVTRERSRDIEIFWWPDSSKVLFLETNFKRGAFLAFYDGSSFRTYDTTGLRLRGAAPSPSGESAFICGRDSRNDTGLIMEFTGPEYEIIWCNESHEIEKIVWSNTDDYALMAGYNRTYYRSHLLFKYNGKDVVPLVDYQNEITPPREIRGISRRPGTDEFYLLYDGVVRVLNNDTVVREIEYNNDHIYDILWESQGSSGFLVGWDAIQVIDGENVTTLPVNVYPFGQVYWEPNGSYALLFDVEYDTSSYRFWKYNNGTVTLVYDNFRIDYHKTGTFKPDGGNIFLTPAKSDEGDGGLMRYDGNDVDFIVKGVKEEDAVNLRLWTLYIVLVISVILILLIVKWKYGFSDEAEEDSSGDDDIPGDMKSHEKIHDESVNRYMLLVWKIKRDKNKKLHVVCPSCGVSADFSVTIKGNLTRFLCENCLAQYTLDG